MQIKKQNSYKKAENPMEPFVSKPYVFAFASALACGL